jgi:S1-C subfamily serine protease
VGVVRRELRGILAVGGALVALLLTLPVAGSASSTATKAPPLGRGVVIVNTNLAYRNAAAAGTGMVLASSGIVLTNNHVIRGANTIRVVVPPARRSYTASVLGYSLTADVAILKLQATSAFTPVQLGNSAKVRTGQTVTALGNAGGTGSLVSSTGRITGIGRAITVQDDQGGAQRMTGLLQTSATLEPGDSGGPLFDTTGHVIGMNTAGSASFFFSGGGGDGYAIPINRALTIAKQVQAGRASSTVHVGPTAFLGVSAQTSSYPQGDVLAPAALVVGVLPGSPAELVGLAPGDVITSVDGRPIQSPTTLITLLLRKAPGDTVNLAWLDQFGTEHSATATLASGPPQ